LHGLNDSSRRTGLFLTRTNDRYQDAEADDAGYNDASNGPNRQGVTEKRTTKYIIYKRVYDCIVQANRKDWWYENYLTMLTE